MDTPESCLLIRGNSERPPCLLVGQVLAALGFEDVAVTRYSDDGGIDVDAVLTVGGVTRVKTAVQVKRWAKKLAGKTVRELRGGLMTDQRGLIITTSSFTKDAVSEADASGKAPISLIDGERFVELLIEKQIGVRKRAVPLLELNIGELVVAEDDQATGDKSATLWPLPGGKANYLSTLLAFLDYIGSTKPSIDEMTDWVIATYEKVTKTTVVRSYLRSVLYSMGVIDFDGDRVVLAPEGENVRQVRSQEEVLNLLKTKVSGIDETLELLATGPKDTPEIREYLNRTLGLTWETDHQVRFRLEWLAACGAVERAAGSWRLTAPNTPI